MNNITILGEMHNNKIDKMRNSSIIYTEKPDVLLHELAYADDIQGDDILQRLMDCDIGKPCDPNLNQDVYGISYLIQTRLVGIDLKLTNIHSTKDMFELREHHMLMMIKRFMNSNYGNIVVVVGDSHLRQVNIPELNPNPLRELYEYDNIKIIRSTNPELY